MSDTPDHMSRLELSHSASFHITGMAPTGSNVNWGSFDCTRQMIRWPTRIAYRAWSAQHHLSGPAIHRCEGVEAIQNDRQTGSRSCIPAVIARGNVSHAVAQRVRVPTEIVGKVEAQGDVVVHVGVRRRPVKKKLVRRRNKNHSWCACHGDQILLVASDRSSAHFNIGSAHFHAQQSLRRNGQFPPQPAAEPCTF